MIVEKLYAVTHPTQGMYYGIGPTRQDAWANALMVAFCILDNDPRAEQEKARLRREGWAARPIEVRRQGNEK